ncbi:MAG: hypothetical protein GF344_14290 [Chitinivibrionales bacterium]|nr:hypothetical protein [Chitinivibrionales bacterium]MBD3357894.1 hypothetical protein [Chitinivibrionales bacterium]
MKQGASRWAAHGDMTKGRNAATTLGGLLKAKWERVLGIKSQSVRVPRSFANDEDCGPSISACTGRYQTVLSCCVQKAWW